MDSRSAVRGEERHQFGHLFRLAGAAERNSAQRRHHALTRFFLADLVVLGQPADERLRGRGLDEARRDGVDTDAVRPEFLRQALAVSAERSLGGSVRQRRVVKRQHALDRRDMDDHAVVLRHHRRQQRAVETHCRQQVVVERLLPSIVIERQRAATGRTGTADVVDQDIDTTEQAQRLLDDGGDAFPGAGIGLDQVHAGRQVRRGGAGRGGDGSAPLVHQCQSGRTHALGAAGDQNAFACEVGVHVVFLDVEREPSS